MKVIARRLTQGVDTAEKDKTIFERPLVFGNLTRPILDQMLKAQGHERNALRHLAKALQEFKMTSGEYGCSTPAGSVEIKVSSRQELRTALRFRTAPSTYGPDELRNKKLSIARINLPEIILSAAEGRKIGEIVDPLRLHFALQHEVVKRAEQRDGYCVFHLDLKFIQPTDEELIFLLSE